MGRQEDGVGAKAAAAVAAGAGNEEPGVKGAARLAGLRLQGGDATSSVVVAAVRQLEQRLEAERRHTERQFQRLERQVEDITKAPPTGGGLAELQGYVDGLSETVQGLVRRSQEPSFSARGPSAPSIAPEPHDSLLLTSIGSRLGAVEERQAEMEKSRHAAKEQLEHACGELQELGARHKALAGAVAAQVEELGARLAQNAPSRNTPSQASSRPSPDLLRLEENHRTLREEVSRLARSFCELAAKKPIADARWDDVVSRIAAAVQRMGKAPMDLFDAVDLNHDGQLSREELERTLRAFQPDLTVAEISAIFDRFDADHSGAVDPQEFCTVLERFSLNGTKASDGHAEQREAVATALEIECIREDIAGLAERLEAAEIVLAGEPRVEGHFGNGCGRLEDCGDAVEDQVASVCEQVDALDGQIGEQLNLLHDRLSDLESWMQDTETNLQDLQMDSDVRHEASHVGDQVMRLAMRMQRLEHDGFGGSSGADEQELRELRGELGHISEQLLHFSGRISHVELGLSGMAEAFERVCEELAQVRADRPSGTAAAESSCEQARSQEMSETRSTALTGEEVSNQSAQHLDQEEPAVTHHKIGEMDRSLQTMAEVVWDLRKQVASLRSNFATLQAAVQGEETPPAPASSRGRSASPSPGAAAEGWRRDKPLP